MIVVACGHVAATAVRSIWRWRRAHALTTRERLRAAAGIAAIVLAFPVVAFVLASPAPGFVRSADRWRGQSLREAARAGDVSRIRAWRWLGAGVEGGAEFPPLVDAAGGGHLEAVRYLLASGARVDHTAPRGCTALALAASQGHEIVVAQLLAHGADSTRLQPCLSDAEMARALATIRSAMARAPREG